MSDKILRFHAPECSVSGIHRHVRTLNEQFLLHTHDYYEFEYAAEGGGVNCINGVEHSVSAGSIWAVGPDDDHRIGGTGLKVYHVSFYLPAVSDDISRLIQSCHFPLCGCIENDQDRERIKSCFELLMHGVPTQPYYREQIHSAAKLTLLCFLTHLHPVESTNNKTVDYVRRAIRYLHDHADDNVRLPGVAASLHIAPCYLSGIFPQYAGCTFGEYLTRIRLGRARELLQNTEESVTDIAGQCGFGCVSAMNRAFRKYFGCSPSQMRRGG